MSSQKDHQHDFLQREFGSLKKTSMYVIVSTIAIVVILLVMLLQSFSLNKSSIITPTKEDLSGQISSSENEISWETKSHLAKDIEKRLIPYSPNPKINPLEVGIWNAENVAGVQFIDYITPLFEYNGKKISILISYRRNNEDFIYDVSKFFHEGEDYNANHR